MDIRRFGRDPLYAGVEQAMKNWEGKKNRAQSPRKIFAAAPPPVFQFAPPPHLLGADALFDLQLRPCML